MLGCGLYFHLVTNLCDTTVCSMLCAFSLVTVRDHPKMKANDMLLSQMVERETDEYKTLDNCSLPARAHDFLSGFHHDFFLA